MCTAHSYSQSETSKGFSIIGDKVIFVFNVNDYENLKVLVDDIEKVNVSGDFNDWALDKWPMQKVNDTLYNLEKPLSDFASDFGWEFKFIVNSTHWAEPTKAFKNITKATTKYGKDMHVYNLKMYSAFATDYGNVNFKLPGYMDANEVILSGSFNKWDETGFKMKKKVDGWQVTLQLHPKTYEYKFIVDGQWIVDPNNPSKAPNEFNGYNSVITVKKEIVFELYGYDNAEKVILSGSFVDWNEEQLIMEKTNLCWRLPLQLTGGKHHYKFIVDGEWITDPLNSVVEYDGNGNINSVIMVK